MCSRVNLALRFALSSQANVEVSAVRLTRVIPETCDALIRALIQTKEALLQEVGSPQCFKPMDLNFESRCLLLGFKLAASATHTALLSLNFLF